MERTARVVAHAQARVRHKEVCEEGGVELLALLRRGRRVHLVVHHERSVHWRVQLACAVHELFGDAVRHTGITRASSLSASAEVVCVAPSRTTSSAFIVVGLRETPERLGRIRAEW